jgi:hypothetical protein
MVFCKITFGQSHFTSGLFLVTMQAGLAAGWYQMPFHQLPTVDEIDF